MQEANELENLVLDLTAESGGGGGGATSYIDLSDKPKMNGITIAGNKTSDDYGLVDDVQINGTSIKSDGVANIPVANTSNTLGLVKVAGTQGMQVSSSGLISGLTKTAVQYADLDNSAFICKGTLNNIQNTFVRAVAPACTIITGTTATITANSTYASTVNSSGLVATLVTPSDLTVYSGFIFQLDTTNSASVAFQTDDSTPVSVVISGSPTLATGKKYTVTGQYSILNNAWELWIIEYKAS